MSVAEKLRKIANYYGWADQTIIAIEEMSELQKAICKWHRDGMTREVENFLVDEIADTLIIVRQLEYLLGPERVGNRIKEKLDRQIERMGRGE